MCWLKAVLRIAYSNKNWKRKITKLARRCLCLNTRKQKCQRWNIIFDCCKQSLTRLYYLPFHPSIQPFIQDHTFCTKKEWLVIYCINLLLFCATHKTGEDLFLYTQNFQLQIFNANAQNFQCRTFSTANFTILLDFFNFLK